MRTRLVEFPPIGNAGLRNVLAKPPAPGPARKCSGPRIVSGRISAPDQQRPTAAGLTSCAVRSLRLASGGAVSDQVRALQGGYGAGPSNRVLLGHGQFCSASMRKGVS